MFVKPRRPRGETRRLVGELIGMGLDQATIAARRDVSASTVCYHARLLGLQAQNKFTRRYHWDAVQQFYDEGNSITACQLRFGFARKTFMDAVERGASPLSFRLSIRRGLPALACLPSTTNRGA